MKFRTNQEAIQFAQEVVSCRTNQNMSENGVNVMTWIVSAVALYVKVAYPQEDEHLELVTRIFKEPMLIDVIFREIRGNSKYADARELWNQVRLNSHYDFPNLLGYTIRTYRRYAELM